MYIDKSSIIKTTPPVQLVSNETKEELRQMVRDEGRDTAKKELYSDESKEQITQIAEKVYAVQSKESEEKTSKKIVYSEEQMRRMVREELSKLCITVNINLWKNRKWKIYSW